MGNNMEAALFKRGERQKAKAKRYFMSGVFESTLLKI
jgi:hypothetical protein